ncbi:MAG TPA: tetratricopeptide repeat protein [Chryseosolibacter sp.]|nr:tetratricopeptide repeat protein [Chryseosolibacter sp.]
MNYYKFFGKILFFIFLPVLNQAFGQNQKVDSLETILKSASREEKPAILNQLSELLRRDEKGMTYVQEAIAIAKETGDQKQEALALKNLGVAYGYNNQYDLARTRILESLLIAEKIKEWTLAGDAAINVGTVYYVIESNYDVALKYYLKALSYYEKASDQKGIAASLSGLGIAYTHEKKFDQALEMLSRSLSLYEQLGEIKEIPKINVNIGSAYRDMREYDKALSYLKKAIAGFEGTNNSRGKAHALFVVGDIYRNQKDFEKAISSLEESLALNRRSDHTNSVADCLLQLAITYKDMQNHGLAVEKFNEAISIASKINKKEIIGKSYKHLAQIHAQSKDFEAAYRYLSLHKTYYDSIFSAEKSQQIEEMQTRFQSERKEQEIQMLRQEQAFNNIYLLVAGGLIVLISIIAFLVINRQKLKIRNERELADKENQLNEERKTLLEAELKNKELAEQQLHDQIEFKNKELASYTLNLIQKNEILENLKESVEEIKNTPETQMRQKLRALVNMVNYSFHLDREWDNFKVHFEQVHKDFFKNLLEQYPDLTANDLKLCSLIKLNLDNKGIAAILNISQESAKVARHRLRKKLDLHADTTLIAYFNSLDTRRSAVLEEAREV